MEHLSEQEFEPEFTQVGEQLSTELVEPGLSEEQMNSSSGDVLIQDWDIGKLIHSNVKLNNLNRVGGSQVYGILTQLLTSSTFVVEMSYLQSVLLLRVRSRVAQPYFCCSNEPLPNYITV